MGEAAIQHLVIVFVIAGVLLLFVTASIERSTGDIETRRDTIDITHLGYLLLVMAGLFQLFVFNNSNDPQIIDL